MLLNVDFRGETEYEVIFIDDEGTKRATAVGFDIVESVLLFFFNQDFGTLSVRKESGVFRFRLFCRIEGRDETLWPNNIPSERK